MHAGPDFPIMPCSLKCNKIKKYTFMIVHILFIFNILFHISADLVYPERMTFFYKYTEIEWKRKKVEKSLQKKVSIKSRLRERINFSLAY